MKDSEIYYSIGALLYCPANNEGIARSIIEEKFGSNYSLALCLEDTINDNFVKEAEAKLIKSLRKIYSSRQNSSFFMPKIFIRVRNSEQISDIYTRLSQAQELVTGFILPKFDCESADGYIRAVKNINKESDRIIYMMPILESGTLIDLRTRYDMLYTIKNKLKQVERYVLNIRVGGNDLCKAFGFRRHSDESIHDIQPISSILSDIVTVFGTDYVVSGPVWEYFNGDNWDKGLRNEIKGDILCGFIGKTVIHPNQIEIVHNAYKVSKKDMEDAQSILHWNMDNASLVSGSQAKERMNEYKTHRIWAEKTAILAKVYGVQE